MANQTSQSAHKSLIQARRRHRPLLPCPTKSQSQSRNPGRKSRPETDQPSAAQEMAPRPGPKKEGPKNRAQILGSIFVPTGRSQTVWLHPCWTKMVPRKRSSKKRPFPKQTQARPKCHQTSNSCYKHCQRRIPQLSAREKHSAISQMWNQTLLRPNTTEHLCHKVVGPKDKLKARILTYIIVLNSTTKNSLASNLKTNNLKH